MRTEIHGALLRELLHLLAHAVKKIEAEYRRQQPDADEGECWAEIEALVSMLDYELPGWRDVGDDIAD